MEGTRPTEETHLPAGVVQGEGGREGRRFQSPSTLVIWGPRTRPGILLP